jgi:autotransporter-associated beta strand protein
MAVKAGAGTLTLDGTLAYDGATTVSNGVLALAGSATLDSVTNTIAVRAGAFLDVNGIGGMLTLGNLNPQTLTGGGTVRGSVTVDANSTLMPGDSTGILTVTNVATLSGTNIANLNRTNNPNSGRLAAQSFVINPGAILIVTNIGPTNFAAGDSFALFNHPVTGLTLGAPLPALPCPGLQWSNRLATDGTLAVIGNPCVNTNPTNITAVVVGNSLDLSWPADHLGWHLQGQTNSPNAGITTNWVTIAGSDSTTHVVIPFNPANGPVFFRLVYP